MDQLDIMLFYFYVNSNDTELDVLYYVNNLLVYVQPLRMPITGIPKSNSDD